jgi:sulfur carrier protein ThiS
MNVKIQINILCDIDSKKIGENSQISMELSNGTTIKQLMNELELQSVPVIVLVNGRNVENTYILSNGDILCIASE